MFLIYQNMLLNGIFLTGWLLSDKFYLTLSFFIYIYLDPVLHQGTNTVCTGPYTWLEWNDLLLSSLQTLCMRSIELVLNCLARLLVYDQLYRMCCILAECWSFGCVICIVCCFYHLFYSVVLWHIWSNNVAAEPVVPFLETGSVSAIALHHWDLHHWFSWFSVLSQPWPTI